MSYPKSGQDVERDAVGMTKKRNEILLTYRGANIQSSRINIQDTYQQYMFNYIPHRLVQKV
jgi:hypothetical protein